MKTFAIPVLLLFWISGSALAQPEGKVAIVQWIDEVAGQGKITKKDWAAIRKLSKAMEERATKIRDQRVATREWTDLPSDDQILLSQKHLEVKSIFRKIVISSASLKVEGNIGGSIVLCNGDIERPRYGAIRDSIIVCNGNIAVSGIIWNCLVFCNGDVLAGSTKDDDVYDSGLFSSGTIRFGGMVSGSVLHAPTVTFLDRKNGYSKSCVYVGQTRTGLPISKRDRFAESNDAPLSPLGFYQARDHGLRLLELDGKLSVLAVEAHSSWEAAGVKGGDILVSIDGSSVTTKTAADVVLSRKKPRSEAVLILQRGDVLVTLKLPF
ncbi:hypothetical protein AYO40_05175 [Planctomycetaceae bacterium SCGC AG-212-D15]|nr:hypothetical protein AYO40_05175 [Planctomycetaceae bacterium SCGC AG-212-D15]